MEPEIFQENFYADIIVFSIFATFSLQYAAFSGYTK